MSRFAKHGSRVLTISGYVFICTWGIFHKSLEIRTWQSKLLGVTVLGPYQYQYPLCDFAGFWDLLNKHVIQIWIMVEFFNLHQNFRSYQYSRVAWDWFCSSNCTPGVGGTIEGVCTSICSWGKLTWNQIKRICLKNAISIWQTTCMLA